MSKMSNFICGKCFRKNQITVYIFTFFEDIFVSAHLDNNAMIEHSICIHVLSSAQNENTIHRIYMLLGSKVNCENPFDSTCVFLGNIYIDCRLLKFLDTPS